jgi:hypothetical protein
MSLLAAQVHRDALERRTPRTVFTTSDQTLIGTSYTDVTGLTFAVEAGKTYHFRFHVLADADAAGTGIDVAVTAPSSPTRLVYSQLLPRATSALAYNGGTSNDLNSANTGSGGTTALEYVVTGTLVNGANAGSITARIKREAVGTGPNVRAGSVGFLWQLT